MSGSIGRRTNDGRLTLVSDNSMAYPTTGVTHQIGNGPLLSGSWSCVNSVPSRNLLQCHCLICVVDPLLLESSSLWSCIISTLRNLRSLSSTL
ncbi:unnamed protein product [Haemonchus placei]|uniref:Uncharacterized protein n=1 Tax=Haemonchus placei TaxID=6290 RepID=A0A3P7UUE9_HAEPC|nr:unnamed protein product [Haemonchus placei]